MEPQRGRVSIIIPTRNSIRTIKACLESARSQRDADVEVIVVDNFSCDGTAQVASRLCDTFVQAGPERSAQRNRGAELATGEFLTFIDSDMVLDTSIAREAVAAFRSPAVGALVVPEYAFGTGFWASCRSLEKRLYVGVEEAEAARVFRAVDFRALGGYDESLTAAEDWELHDRLAREKGRISRIEAHLHHDEGALRLVADLRKKFYYGHTIAGFVRKRPRLTARRLARLPILRKRELILSSPVLAVGLLTMKGLEAIAVLLGSALAASSNFRRIGK